MNSNTTSHAITYKKCKTLLLLLLQYQLTWKGCQGHSHPLVRGDDTEGSFSEELGISSEDINKYSKRDKDSLNNE